MTATLMEVAYGMAKVTAAQRDRDLRSELANTWDNDLRILCDAGMMVEFDPITYPVEIQPDWTEGGRGYNKRPNGFWDQLRTSKLKILPPQDIAEGIAKLQRKKKSNDATAQPVPLKRSKQAPPLSGEQIKAAREAKGWSQDDLGKQLSRTKMWVSLISGASAASSPRMPPSYKIFSGFEAFGLSRSAWGHLVPTLGNSFDLRSHRINSKHQP